MNLLCEVNTGRIVGSFDCPDFMFEVISANFQDYDIIEGADLLDPNIYYYNGINTIIIRPEFTATYNKLEIQANGTDLFILSGLPIGCVVTIKDNDLITEDIQAIIDQDGEISFPTVITGKYKVTAKLFPYITKEWELIAI